MPAIDAAPRSFSETGVPPGGGSTPKVWDTVAGSLSAAGSPAVGGGTGRRAGLRYDHRGLPSRPSL